ncbi:MAG: carbonic anhydrase [Candidatus Eremiobacteraeota bacterium]|nr:carbonic anhydrase [Candidatus Eremiobacteraeota bacterium]
MMNRGNFVRSSLGAAAALAGLPYAALAAEEAAPVRYPSAEALALLAAGNKRFAGGASLKVDHTARRVTLTSGQNPFAIVLACADSRVAPEVIFDQGLGDLFVVRVAGNFADADGIGSIEYAVSHFGSSVLLVLGHSGCGAVHATVDLLKSGGTAPGDIQSIVTALTPAAKAAMSEPGDAYVNCIRENVKRNVAKLQAQKPIIAEAVEKGRLRVSGGVYDLASGLVSML